MNRGEHGDRVMAFFDRLRGNHAALEGIGRQEHCRLLHLSGGCRNRWKVRPEPYLV